MDLLPTTVEKKKKSLEKRKTSKTKREKQIDDAKDVIKDRGNALSDWRIPDFIKMIRYKTPKAVLSSKTRPQLLVIWNAVKNLPAPDMDDIPKWNEKDENTLIEFRKDGRSNISRSYVMRRVERRKMEVLEGQVAALLPKNKVKTLGSILQSLDDDERADLIDNWETHNIDDVYSFSTTSSIGSTDDIDDDDDGQQINHQLQQQQQQQPEVIIEFNDSSKEEDEEEKKEKEKNIGWDSDKASSNESSLLSSSSSSDKDDYGAVGNQCFGNESDDNKSDNEVRMMCVCLYVVSLFLSLSYTYFFYSIAKSTEKPTDAVSSRAHRAALRQGVDLSLIHI